MVVVVVGLGGVAGRVGVGVAVCAWVCWSDACLKIKIISV